MTATYFAIATDIGNAKDANAKALGLPRKYVALAIGDGGGDNAPVPTPKTSQKALLGEWRRAALNSLDVDPKAPSQLIAEQVIPETEGGKWIRELGLFDEDGDLCYVSNAPPTYKPTLPEGSGKTQSVRMVIVNSSGVNVELKIDPSVILATREYVDKGLKAHVDAPDPHTQYFKKVGGAISGPVTIGGVDDDLTGTKLIAYGRIRGSSSTGAVTASNGKGVGQTSIHLMREGADVDAKTWELLHGSSGSFALRAVSDDYKSSTTVFSVDRPAGITSAVMRLMQSGGRLLINGSPDDGLSPLQVKGVATFDTPARGDNSRRAATTQFVTTALAGFAPVYSIQALPATNIGPIIVAEVAEVWVWSATQYYTGYRSPLCGRPLDGHTVVPLPSEIDAVGGTLSKAAYASLWAYAQENALIVPSASWTAGMHRFVDLGGDNFRVPDLRNQFRRYTGTDADTANATTMGSSKIDTMRSHNHSAQSG
ncbi:phage tail protein, partial [Pandoraea captiosa]|uniref:phage tail protein n=1 Tax=Pandoraea captiosa TaxID=2508302 RepID=UPI001FEA726F